MGTLHKSAEAVLSTMERDAEVIARRMAVAYGDCDLNVARTAERLGVHPNTVHYRLRRVRELTGRDPRRFAGLVELTAALELAQPS